MAYLKYAHLGSCPPGEPHEIGSNREGRRICKNCGMDASTICDWGGRGLIKGEFRVVCDGVDGGGVCPIGPSEPTPMVGHAQELLAEHQGKAKEADGERHHAKIIQL